MVRRWKGEGGSGGRVVGSSWWQRRVMREGLKEGGWLGGAGGGEEGDERGLKEGGYGGWGRSGRGEMLWEGGMCW